MGRRLLKITVELLVNIFKGFDDIPKYFKVVRDPIPKDVRIISVQNSPYYENIVEVELESEQWTGDAPKTEVRPEFMEMTSSDSVQRYQKLELAIKSKAITKNEVLRELDLPETTEPWGSEIAGEQKQPTEEQRKRWHSMVRTVGKEKPSQRIHSTSPLMPCKRMWTEPPPVKTKSRSYIMDPIEFLKRVYEDYKLEVPNPNMTKSEFILALLSDIEEYGHGLVWKIPNLFLKTAEIWPLSVKQSVPHAAMPDFPNGYYVTVDPSNSMLMNAPIPAQYVDIIRIPGDLGPVDKMYTTMT